MSEEPSQRRTGATFADVWPAVPPTLPATPPLNSPPTAQLGASTGEGELTSAAPVTRTRAPRERLLPSRPTATERTIAPRAQRISTETFEGKLLGYGPAR